MLETFSFIRYRIFNTYNFISLEFFFISNFQFYYNTNDLFFIFMISQIRIQPLWNRNHTFVPRSSLPTKTTSMSSMPRPLHVSMIVLLTQHSATFWWCSICFLSLARIFYAIIYFQLGAEAGPDPKTRRFGRGQGHDDALPSQIIQWKPEKKKKVINVPVKRPKSVTINLWTWPMAHFMGWRKKSWTSLLLNLGWANPSSQKQGPFGAAQYISLTGD